MSVPAAFATEGGEPGHWEVLGEDGAIWVPAHPVSGAYLPPAGLGAFHDHAELTAALADLAAAHPGLASVASLGVSVEGRDVWAVTLRAGPDDGRPAVLFDGAHHGDEVIASEILLRYAQTLASEYPSTQRSRQILENVTLVIVPMVNPDGIMRAHNSTDYADARKNARGVDLNRNYAATWGGAGSSGSPSSATYRGPTAASEPETQAMQDLLRSRNWTFYSSLHSGAEMILWPYGHVTSPPPEAATYERLGDELTALTSAPNGQVSQILYSVSGDSMDAAYINAGPHWKPLATSPETYEGSGSAFDWWYLFNPTDAGIGNVVARWTKFLDHLAMEAPHYAPASLHAPAGHTGPGAPFDLAASVTSPLKRPLVSGSASLAAPEFLTVTSANPIALPTLNGTSQLSWSLVPSSGGAGEATVRVGVGPAGNLTARFPIVITAPGITLDVAPATVGSGQTFTATLRAQSDVPLSGIATLTWEGAPADVRPVTLDGTNDLTWTVAVDAADAPAGARPVSIALAYETAGGAGVVSDSASVFVDRPSLVATRVFPEESAAGSPTTMTLSLRNMGTRAALNTTVRETLPAGYAPWLRSAGTIDPIAKPMPARASVTPTGEVVLEWDAPTLMPSGNYRIELALLPTLPGEHTLATDYAYGASYPGGWSYAYEGALRTEHHVVVPSVGP